MRGLKFYACLLMMGCLLGTGALLMSYTSQASADQCNDGSSWYGEGCFHGYFNAANTSQGGADVMPGGFSASSKADFINKINALRTSGVASKVTAANFVILTMSGLNHGRPNSVSAAQLTDWQNRVNSSAVTMKIEGALFACGTFNTYYQYANDIAAGSATSSEGCGGTDTMIDFYAGGQLVYRIREVCGNPLGNYKGLPPAVVTPPTTGSITSVACTSAEAASTYTVHATFYGSKAVLLGSNGVSLASSTVSPATWSTRTLNWPLASWPVKLYVQAKGATGYTLYDTAAMPNCNPYGTIKLGCTSDGSGNGTAEIHFADPNGGNPLGYIAVPGTNAALTGQHASGFVWIVPAARAAAPTWDLWLDAQDIGLPGSPFKVIAGAAYNSCAGAVAPTASCTTSTFPGKMEVNTPQSFTVSADISSPPPSPPTNPALTVGIAGPNGYSKTFPNQGYTYDATKKSITSSAVAFTPPTIGTYKLVWSLSGFVTEACGYGAADGGTPNTGEAATYPYFDVEGGDIAAGANFSDSSGTCTQNNADIAGWNYDNSPAGYYGAGTQMAALASGDIQSFVTGLNPAANRSNVAGRTGTDSLNFVGRPTALAFANAGSGVNVSSGHYGGSYTAGGGLLPCITDYASQITGGAAWNGDYTDSGVYEATGPTVLATGDVTIPHDTVIELKVDGDVYLDGNINYDDGGGALHYPRLTIVATGSIYVSGSVTTLHGLFVAQNNTDGDGIFATCATRNGTDFSETTDFDTCNNNLTVYGAVAANQLNLERTSGSRASSSGPAESFRYTPELWLPTPLCKVLPTSAPCTGPGTKSQKADAIISLPPVL